MIIEAITDGIKIFMAFVYGDPGAEQPQLVWERHTRFKTTRKKGARQRSVISFLPLKQILSDCGKLRFSLSRKIMSWVGKRGKSTERCRLDRAVGNKDWHEKFSHSSVQ